MPREVYDYWYNWGDSAVLENLLRGCHRHDFTVVEIAAGPNVAVPYALRKIESPFYYISVDIEKAHIHLQKKAVGARVMEGVVGEAAHLPVRLGCADVFVFHHAIDDILETSGFEGVKASLVEALRALKAGGCMIFSHSVFSYDPYTIKIDLSDIEEYLRHKIDGRFKRISGHRQRWLVVKDIALAR